MRPKFSLLLLVATTFLASSISAQLFAEGGLPTAGTYGEMFRVSPVYAYKHAVKIRNRTNDLSFLGDEIDLLEDALDGRLDSMSFEDAMLTVSEITEKAKRDHYKVQIYDLVEKCRAATENLETVDEKGEEILRIIRSGPLSKGFENNQTFPTVALDSGKYNCVSSSVVFQLVTHKLKIKAVTVTVPNHVFCRVGKTDFETYDGRVLPTLKRKERYTEKRQPRDMQPGAPFEKVISRETNDLGLLALIYFNEGAIMRDRDTNPDCGGAVIKMFKAACLDKNSRWVSINLEKSIRKWFNAEMSKKHYKECKWIADFYKRIIREESYADELYAAIKTDMAKAGILENESLSIARNN